MTLSDQHKKLQLLIDALPKDESGLVQYLVDLGVKGKKKKASSCALAKFFQSRGLEGAAVNGDEASCVGSAGKVTVSLPEHLKSFVTNFDRGAYPALTVPEAGYQYKNNFNY